jgi:hypothetical protein
MKLNRIRLALARTSEFPEGSHRHGYEFIAPLTSNAHIDVKIWKDVKTICKVIRFWGDEEREVGILRHVRGGWRFDYDPDSENDDEPFFKLDSHALEPGAYVSITEHDGVQRPFRVTSVTPVLGR